MLWLIELEQITTKPFAWMLIYGTITTNFEGKNTFDLSVPCEWPHYTSYMGKCLNRWNWTFQTKVMANRTWTNHNQAICMDVNLWYDDDKFWGENHFWFKCSMWTTSLPAMGKCLNCWNWTFQTKVMANRTWTNHNQAICMDVNLWYDDEKFWGEKHFWFKCSMWMTSLPAMGKCLNCWNWTFQTKVMANRTWTNHNQAICMDVNLWYDDNEILRGKTLLI